MRVELSITVQGEWLENGKPASPAVVERRVRDIIKREYEFLAQKVVVKRVVSDSTMSKAFLAKATAK